MSDDENFEHSEESESPPKLTQKEYAKKMRRAAYDRAKEFKKNDPKEKARKEAAKIFRKELYQKAKEKNKKAKECRVVKEKPDLSDKIFLASDLLDENKPLAKVIPIDFRKLRK